MLISLNKYKEVGLPPRLIYINSQNEKKLLEATPNSTKNWVRASIYYNDKLKNIRLRYGGDNPINWLLEKKRIRIKSNKLELFDTKRYLEYFPLNISNLYSYEIMSALGLISNHIGLVEVYINGISKGIFHEKRVINESFIRQNKIMPINVYKGENHAAEKNLTLNSFFESPKGAKVVCGRELYEKEGYTGFGEGYRRCPGEHLSLIFVEEMANHFKSVDFEINLKGGESDMMPYVWGSVDRNLVLKIN